jgi:hypothetical protein
LCEISEREDVKKERKKAKGESHICTRLTHLMMAPFSVNRRQHGIQNHTCTAGVSFTSTVEERRQILEAKPFDNDCKHKNYKKVSLLAALDPTDAPAPAPAPAAPAAAAVAGVDYDDDASTASTK